MKLNPRILVAIPTFNNAATLGTVIKCVLEKTQHLLVVNDGSTDATGELIASFPQIYSVTLSQNSGKGSALVAAFRWAKQHGYSTVVTMDADGQHLAQELDGIVAAVENHPGTIVIGARNFDPSAGDVPNSSKFGRSFSDFWVHIETGKKVFDTQSGFRAYPVDKIPFESLSARHYDFEIEILVRSLWKGIPAISVPIQVFYPPREQRVSYFLPFKDNARLSRLHTSLVVRRIFNLFAAPSLKTEGRRGPGLMSLCLRVFGLKWCYRLLYLIVPIYFLTGLAHVLPNLRFHKQRGQRSLLKQVIASWKTHLYFAASLLDRAAIMHGMLSPQFDLDIPPDFFARKGGFILVGAHFGDWTLSANALAGEHKNRIAIVMDTARSRIFQSRFGARKDNILEFIDAGRDSLEVMLDIREKLSEGNIVCFLGDRGFRETRMTPVHFLGKEAQFPAAPFEIGKRLKYPVYAFFCFKKELSHSTQLKLVIREIHSESSTALEMLNEYVRELETIVRTRPWCWFNFFDFWEPSKGAP
jgi:predicted LPLAT superfamily acyltransferase